MFFGTPYRAANKPKEMGYKDDIMREVYKKPAQEFCGRHAGVIVVYRSYKNAEVHINLFSFP